MVIKTISVSDVNNYIKKVIDNDFILNNLSVKGEISNFKLHSSGHIYFSLKDEKSKLNCIMFRSYAQHLNFIPENGMMVTIRGNLSVYLKDGVYQIYCEELKEQGTGDLYNQFLKLKDKLTLMGIFDEKHKKSIPLYSKKIGVITSPTGAAIRDIINVTKRRNKGIEIIIYPSLVQGIGASTDMINGINTLNAIKDIDVIILARGGGSIEELWEFNNEALVYAVYNSQIPIITGVGHETDFTIVDFASDKRASTPSAAAEIATFNLNETNNVVLNCRDKLISSINNNIKAYYDDVKYINKNLQHNSPEMNIINKYNLVYNLTKVLNINVSNKIDINKEKLGRENSLLIAHNPLKLLNKGYSIIRNKTGTLINTIGKLKNEEVIDITLSDGSIKTLIEFIK